MEVEETVQWCATTFTTTFEEQGIWIRDKAVKAVIEASPQQRARNKTLFAALEVVKSKLTPDKYEVCVRTMQITTSPRMHQSVE